MNFTLIKYICGAVFTVLLFYAAYKDIKTRKIPNVVCLLICALAVLQILIKSNSMFASVSSLIITVLPIFIINLIKKDSFGAGDIKLLGSVGLFLGIGSSFVMLFVTFLAFSIITKIRKQENQIVPFAPYVTAGALTAYLLSLILEGVL